MTQGKAMIDARVQVHASGSADNGLPASVARTLRCIVAMIIPASQTYQLPGADDAHILADIAASLGRDRERVLQALNLFESMASEVQPGAWLDELPAAVRETVVGRFRAAQPALATVLADVTVRCYYRDDRVMRAIGMQARAPFPEGFALEQGDWSLLDPVRARGPIWRDPG
jgi:hypothetical protein